MKIAAGIVCYADPEGLDRLLLTLKIGRGGFDGAIVIHRRFDHFDYHDPNSLKDTQTVCKKYPNVVLDHDGDDDDNDDNPTTTPRITQIEARNRYLQLAGELGYDWLMVLDSDEYILPNADWQEFRRQLEFIQSLGLDHQVFDIQYEGHVAESGPRPRLFLDPSSIIYWQRHDWFILKKKSELLKGCGDAGRLVGGIYPHHSKFIRRVQHLEASLLYYQWQQQIETPTPESMEVKQKLFTRAQGDAIRID